MERERVRMDPYVALTIARHIINDKAIMKDPLRACLNPVVTRTKTYSLD